MTPAQVKQKISVETASLMHLKVDNVDVVKHTFQKITEQVAELLQSTDGQNETYQKAFSLLDEAMHNEYVQFAASVIHDEKEQLLIQLRHKAAEACALIQHV